MDRTELESGSTSFAGSAAMGVRVTRQRGSTSTGLRRRVRSGSRHPVRAFELPGWLLGCSSEQGQSQRPREFVSTAIRVSGSMGENTSLVATKGIQSPLSVRASGPLGPLGPSVSAAGPPPSTLGQSVCRFRFCSSVNAAEKRIHLEQQSTEVEA